jgi:hypothetical protein
MATTAADHCTLWTLGLQQLHLDFQGGTLVADAGLLAIRALERPLRIIADLAERLPDPRSPKYITHSVEALLTQEVYALLAGYPDHNDATELRDDPLFQILAEVSPDPEHPLASGSTTARFSYAYTRRDAELPPAERPVLQEVRDAQIQRLKILNGYLPEVFIRTRTTPPAEIILDVDATDDPVHGRQTLAGYHGYYRQHQFLPLLVFEGHSGFPLAAWLRPGAVHASLGATDVLSDLVGALRAAWPDVRILVRADNGLAVPLVYDFCEQQRLDYVLGYASNPVLERATAQAWDDLHVYYRAYGRRDPHVQRFEDVPDYQAGSWPRPRRVVAKIEITPQGSQRRFVVTNLTAAAEVVYRQIYVRRGAVPEQPIGEMKNGLRCERLSACGFCANAFRLLVHTLAYALVVLFRQACAALPGVATATVATLRQRLWKVGAVVVTGVRRLWLHVSEAWQYRPLWQAALAAVQAFVAACWGRQPLAPPRCGSPGR